MLVILVTICCLLGFQHGAEAQGPPLSLSRVNSTAAAILNTTWPNVTVLNEMMPLWEPAARGDPNIALNVFFNATGPKSAEREPGSGKVAPLGNEVFRNECFMDPDARPECQAQSDKLYVLQDLKTWMRSPACTSSRDKYASLVGAQPTGSASTPEINDDDDQPARCCDNCVVWGENIDLYYWPDPHADISCLARVFNNHVPNRPETGYATTNALQNSTYWGCKSTISPTTTAAGAGPSLGARYKIYTTAVLTSVGSILYKLPLSDPYKSNECDPPGYTAYPYPNQSTISYDASLDMALKNQTGPMSTPTASAGPSSRSQGNRDQDGFPIPSAYVDLSYHPQETNDQGGFPTPSAFVDPSYHPQEGAGPSSRQAVAKRDEITITSPVPSPASATLTPSVTATRGPYIDGRMGNGTANTATATASPMTTSVNGPRIHDKIQQLVVGTSVNMTGAAGSWMQDHFASLMADQSKNLTGTGTRGSWTYSWASNMTSNRTMLTTGTATGPSTVVSGQFTFTSPYIYANFRGVQASDVCGPDRGPIYTTMLSFLPGELSTIVGPPRTFNPSGPSSQPSDIPKRPFNFADLPCPPESIMREAWYLPIVSEPYRPKIAFPEKLRKLNKDWSNCHESYFTAYNGPQTLVPGRMPEVPWCATASFCEKPTYEKPAVLKVTATVPDPVDAELSAVEAVKVPAAAAAAAQATGQRPPELGWDRPDEPAALAAAAAVQPTPVATDGDGGLDFFSVNNILAQAPELVDNAAAAAGVMNVVSAAVNPMQTQRAPGLKQTAALLVGPQQAAAVVSPTPAQAPSPSQPGANGPAPPAVPQVQALPANDGDNGGGNRVEQPDQHIQQVSPGGGGNQPNNAYPASGPSVGSQQAQPASGGSGSSPKPANNPANPIINQIFRGQGASPATVQNQNPGAADSDGANPQQKPAADQNPGSNPGPQPGPVVPIINQIFPQEGSSSSPAMQNAGSTGDNDAGGATQPAGANANANAQPALPILNQIFRHQETSPSAQQNGKATSPEAADSQVGGKTQPQGLVHDTFGGSGTGAGEAVAVAVGDTASSDTGPGQNTGYGGILGQVFRPAGLSASPGAGSGGGGVSAGFTEDGNEDGEASGSGAGSGGEPGSGPSPILNNIFPHQGSRHGNVAPVGASPNNGHSRVVGSGVKGEGEGSVPVSQSNGFGSGSGSGTDGRGGGGGGRDDAEDSGTGTDNENHGGDDDDDDYGSSSNGNDNDPNATGPSPSLSTSDPDSVTGTTTTAATARITGSDRRTSDTAVPTQNTTGRVGKSGAAGGREEENGAAARTLCSMSRYCLRDWVFGAVLGTALVVVVVV